METTTVAGRTWNFVKAIGRNAAAGNGFTQPSAVAIAGDGSMYVLSRGQEGAGGVVAQNKRIGKVTMNDELIGDFGRREFTWPADLAVSKDDNLYCSDEYGNFIAWYSSDGERLGQWGEAGSGEGQLSGPSGIAFDSDDNLYVVDSLNDRVQKFTKDGNFITSWGGSGSGGGQLNRPWGIAVDKDDNVYVADWGNDRVQKFSADGNPLLTFGGASGQGGDLLRPSGVAVDSEGDVYVVDWGNKKVQIYDPEGQALAALYGDAFEWSSWAKQVVESNPDVVKAYRRVKDRTAIALLERPVGIAIDDEDRIIITESTRGRIQIYAKEKDYMDAQFNL
jgi:DNA-binding beta-propeller fold protein YncE